MHERQKNRPIKKLRLKIREMSIEVLGSLLFWAAGGAIGALLVLFWNIL